MNFLFLINYYKKWFKIFFFYIFWLQTIHSWFFFSILWINCRIPKDEYIYANYNSKKIHNDFFIFTNCNCMNPPNDSFFFFTNCDYKNVHDYTFEICKVWNCINPHDGSKCNTHAEKGGKEGIYFIQFWNMHYIDHLF